MRIVEILVDCGANTEVGKSSCTTTHLFPNRCTTNCPIAHAIINIVNSWKINVLAQAHGALRHPGGSFPSLPPGCSRALGKVSRVMTCIILGGMAEG